MKIVQIKARLPSLIASMLLLPLGTAAHPQALSESKDEVIYTIRDGDTLIGLGNRFFVSAEAYKTVERANGMSETSRLRIGSTIIIPTSVLKFTPLVARVIAFKGHANLVSSGHTIPVALQMQVSEGTLIETAPDGYLTLQLASGSKVAIPSNARVRISRMRTYLLTKGTDTDFTVERGRTETTVVPLRDNRSRFRIRTPVAISAVRGTVLRIGYDGPDAASLTEVVEGHVAVSLTGSTARTTLPSGFGAAASSSGKLDREALLPPPTFVDGDAEQRGSAVTFKLRPDQASTGYHIEVAKDAAFVDIVTGGRSSGPSVEIGALPDGTYWARAMAIAPSGLEGLPQTQSFTRRLEALVAYRLPGSKRAYRLTWNLAATERATYRLQLFEARDPSTPVIDEPGLTSPEMTVYGLAPGRYSWRIGRVRSVRGKLEQYWTPFESLSIDL